MVLRDPLPEERQHAHALVDPRFVLVGGIPQAAGRSNAESGGGRVGFSSRVYSDPLPHRVEVHVEDVEDSGAGSLLVLADLAQVPGDQRLIAVEPAVGPKLYAECRILRRILVAEPPPFGRTGNPGFGVRPPHRGRVGDRLLEELVVGRGLRVHIAVRGIPQTRLVVENVGVDASASRSIRLPDPPHPLFDDVGR